MLSVITMDIKVTAKTADHSTVWRCTVTKSVCPLVKQTDTECTVVLYE